MTIIKS